MRSRSVRWLALFAAGGCLFQAVGCVSGLVPVVLSIAESVAIDLIFGSLLP